MSQSPLNLSLPGIDPPDRVLVANMTMQERIDRAIALLRKHEPPEGYWEAFSAGKDSCVVDRLAKMAGVRYTKRYQNVTIDPPELIRFMKRAHPDAIWEEPKHGPLFHRVATSPHTPPTRMVRWCCEEYKECGGCGRVKLMGVRAAESPKRKQNWREMAQDLKGNPTLCVIVHWSTEQLWDFIHSEKVPYCELYDEGFSRIGCVGCPLNPESREREFRRWPRYRDLWRSAIIQNWKNWKDIPNSKTGGPRLQARFRTGDDFWQWWMTAEWQPDVFRDGCQSGILWTNENGDE